MQVPKIKTDQGFVPDIPQAIEPYVLGYSLNPDGETYTLTLDESKSLSPLQVRKQLRNIGMLDAVKAQIEGDEDMQEAFEYAVKMYIYSPTVQKIASELGWSSEQLEEFFEEASKIFI
jgi:hypothetical protein